MLQTARALVVLFVALQGAPLQGQGQQIEFETLEHSTGSRLKGARDEVILDQERLAVVWRELFGDRDDAPAVPTVDFGERMVVVVAMGQQPSTNFTISVTKLTLVRGVSDGLPVMRVHIREVRPRGCTVLPTGTGPVHVIAAPRAFDVTFVRTRAWDRCR